MPKEYPKGIYFNRPRENAPEFVLGSISIKKQEFLEWLDQKETNEKGYVNLDVLNGKEEKPYLAVNDYKPKGIPTIDDEERTGMEAPMPNF